MILGDVEALVDLIEHKSQLQQNVNQLAGFRTRLVELQESLQDLEGRTAILSAFTARGFEKPDVSAKAHVLLNQVNSILSNFRDSPSSIITYSNVVFKSSLRSINNDLSAFVSESWHAYTDKDLPTNPNALDGFASISLFAPIVQEIRVLAVQIAIRRRTPPLGNADFEEFDQLIADARSAWNKLGETDLPVAVVRFLQSAGSREGASLDLLTVDVNEWLSTKEIRKSFRIRIDTSGN